MSEYDYKKCLEISRDPEISFYSLIMAAMMRADTYNFLRLEAAFPNVRDELQARYDGRVLADQDDCK